MTPPEESALLARCRAGEAAAWDELFTAHYAAAARFIFQLGSDFTHEDAEEIAQETFLAVVKNLQTFHGESRFQTWLFRIAANKAQDHREKQRAAKRGGGHANLSLQAEDAETGLAIDPPAATPAPDASLAGGELFAQVRTAVERLDSPCREVIELRYFGDLSYEEIASALRLNPKTVSSRLSKCLDKLEMLAQKIFSGETAAVFPSNN